MYSLKPIFDVSFFPDQETDATSAQSVIVHLLKVQTLSGTWQDTGMIRSLYVMTVVQHSHGEIT